MQEQLIKYLKQAAALITKYSVVFVLVVVVAVTLLAVSKIDQAANVPRDENLYNSLQSDIKVIRFDDDTIQDIRDLKESGASVDSDFPNNRRNPF